MSQTLAYAALKTLPARWAHTQAVGRKASILAYQLPLTPLERARLIDAAWLHDIGYAFPDLHSWHPIAGALHLEQVGHDDVASLVAWHSTAAEESELLGYGDDLATWEHEDSIVQDALDWLDMTTGPSGQPFTVSERLADVRVRHGRDSTQYQALLTALPRLEELSLTFGRYESRHRSQPAQHIEG